MKIHLKKYMAVTIFLLLTVSGFSRAEIASDTLWQKAVEIATQNQAWVPGQIDMRSEELGKKDTVTSVEEVRTRLFLGDDGTMQEETVVMKDGKVVESSLKQQEKQGKQQGHQKKQREKSDDNSISMSSENFFMPEEQAMISAAPTDQRKTIDGKTCVAYAFTQEKSEKHKITGTAWREENSGMPAEVEFTPIPKPKHVKKMTNIIRYNTTSPDAWYPKEMFMDVSGGFLLIKKHFRISMAFSEYWQASPELLSELNGIDLTDKEGENHE